MRRIVTTLTATLLPAVAAMAQTDTIPGGFSRPPEWQLGTAINAGGVAATNGYLRGVNHLGEKVDAGMGAAVRLGFSFAPDTREGQLYRGLYQGIGVGWNTFFAGRLLGTPVTVHVYQGAPVATVAKGVTLGYEWQFGAAAGWKHDNQPGETNAAVSTAVTAYMGLGLKLTWQTGERVSLWAGAEAMHYSNGNTSFPNSGVNVLGATLGVTYMITQSGRETPVCRNLAREADRSYWYTDIMAYGAWRKRVADVGDTPQICPGHFAVAGVQVAPMRQLNRLVAVGPSLDIGWDEGAGLAPYWVDGTYGDEIKFERPPFGKQIKVGVSAHAELTMPIFHVNAGVGYDVLCPVGDKRFYQSLTLKTFVTRDIYINTGYRLGAFSTPQHLMLGVGVRL